MLHLYLYLARRWILFAIIPALLASFLGYVYSARQPRTFATSALLYVQQPALSSSVPGSTDVFTSQALIPTYTQMIQSPVVAHGVNRRMGIKYPGYRLQAPELAVAGAGIVPGTSPQNTQLMSVSVTDTDPQRASAAANAVAHVFIYRIVKIQKARYRGGADAIQQQIDGAESNIQSMSARIQDYQGRTSGLEDLKARLSAYQSIYQSLLASQQQFRVARNTAVNSVRLFSRAPVPTLPIGPHPVRTGLLWGFIALLLCGCALLAYDHLDDSLRSPEQIEDLIGAPVLGTVRAFPGGRGGSELVDAQGPASRASEAYCVVRTNLGFVDADSPPRTIVISSATQFEGKSVTAANLAIVFANAGRQVVLIDGDMRRPSLHRMFGLNSHPGLADLLAGAHSLDGYGSQHVREHEHLDVVVAGRRSPRPADLLYSSRLQEVVSHFRQECDLVILDSPPILAFTDAAILSSYVDGVVLVVDPHRSTRRDVRRARDAIDAVGGRVLGVVINRVAKSDIAYSDGEHMYGYEHPRIAAGSVSDGERVLTPS